MLTGGNVADCTAGAELLARLPPCEILHGDKGYDSNAIRRRVEDGGPMPNISPKANRKWKNCFAVPVSQTQRHRAHVPPVVGLQARRDAI
jgi:IS5 family transposase